MDYLIDKSLAVEIKQGVEVTEPQLQAEPVKAEALVKPAKAARKRVARPSPEPEMER